MANLFLDGQLHMIGRDLKAREQELGQSFDVDREIREIHDRDMLVPEQKFEQFAHDAKLFYRLEKERSLNAPTLNPVGLLTYKLRKELSKKKSTCGDEDGLPA